MRGNIGRGTSDLIEDYIWRSFPFWLFVWTNECDIRLIPRLDTDPREVLLDPKKYMA